MKNNLLPVANAGWTYITGAILFFLVFSFLDLGLFQFVAFLATIFFIFLFRNPERQHIYYQEDSVVSPVDGTVTTIQELKDNEYAYKVEIDSSYLNVSLLRSPFTSLLKQISKQNGARLSSSTSLSKKINENAELVFIDTNSNSVKIQHLLKQSFMPIEIEVIKSQNLYQGARYGVMVNGLTTIYLPQNFRLNVSVGADLIASETLIGYFTKTID